MVSTIAKNTLVWSLVLPLQHATNKTTKNLLQSLTNASSTSWTQTVLSKVNKSIEPTKLKQKAKRQTNFWSHFAPRCVNFERDLVSYCFYTCTHTCPKQFFCKIKLQFIILRQDAGQEITCMVKEQNAWHTDNYYWRQGLSSPHPKGWNTLGMAMYWRNMAHKKIYREKQ